MKRFFAVTCILAMALIAPIVRGAVIVVGTHNLLPKTAGQVIQIFVTGGNPVAGLDFNAQVADGGPEAGGTMVAPAITKVDLITGTIFQTNNTGPQDPGSVPQLAIRTITVAHDTVPAEGLIATVTIDTTDFLAGTWTFALGNTLNGPTDFGTTPATITDGTITDGTITIVPEPLAGSWVAMAALTLMRRTRRGVKRNRHSAFDKFR